MFTFLLNCFVNFIFPHRITKPNPILIHDQTIPYLNTLPNYTLSLYITELSFQIALSQNSRHILSAGVIISPCRNNYPRVTRLLRKTFINKVRKEYLEKVSQCQNWIIKPTTCLYTLQNPIVCTNTLLITVPYLNKLPNKLAFLSKQKIVGIQSESSTKNP